MKNKIILIATLAVFIAGQRAVADTYYVNRSFTDGINTATLVGTLDIPEGTWTIMNAAPGPGGPSPFTAVNLTLTVDDTSYTVDNVVTGAIYGTGTFSISATPTALIFSASGTATNPADLDFMDNPTGQISAFYSIGSDGDPAYETAAISTASVQANVDPVYPVTFGVEIVPEPSVLGLLAIGIFGIGFLRRHQV
jgi:hypothetical protein